MEPTHVTGLREQGYAIIRGFLPPEEVGVQAAAVDRLYAEGMQHHATYRDKNLGFEVLNDPRAGRRVVIQAYWSCWINQVMEAQRPDPRYLEVLAPNLGRDIPLGPAPGISRFEDLHDHPEPFYIEEDWTGEQPSPAQTG